MTTLTVREAVYYSAELQLPPSLSGPDKRSRAEDTIREMGLLAAGDTRIGRVSGGQRRRVSVCVEMLTRPRLLFLDEPTSGLDSAASYHVLGRIARLACREAMTVVASVHQPSGEMLDMFHSLFLLAYGKTVYFGPTSLANEFFALNGFPCPSLTNPSDHYLRTINKDFDQDVEEGLQAMPTSVAKAIETLVDSYKSSILSQQVMHRIAEIHEKGGGLVKKGSRASFTVQCLVLTRRSFVNMYRDAGYYWLRLVIYIALGICLGTMFHDLGHSHSYGSIQDRGSMLMFVSGFLTFMAIGGFPSFVEDMKIFARERLNGHYGVTPFVIGNTLSSAPYLALVSVVPGSHSLLHSRPQGLVPTLRLLHPRALHQPAAGGEPDDDRGERGAAQLPHGHHRRRRDPGRHAAQRRLLPAAQRHPEAGLAVPVLLRLAPQVRQPGAVQERVHGTDFLRRSPLRRRRAGRLYYRKWRGDTERRVANGDGPFQVDRFGRSLWDGGRVQAAVSGDCEDGREIEACTKEVMVKAPKQQ
ncbi:ABC transporter G family member 11-like [Iris pallida]|uniref:ABC transporter G family member 11-like n=1 Tax=Iris pallida TaxID=29817 RepID=A0AAX6DJI3_IRIPA|nr:ABC transporter G family member 11-like [Iris pallida]